MKIAIITLPLHTNYGGILQAYALQTVLERMGHEVEHLQPVVRYSSIRPLRVLPLAWIKLLCIKLSQGDWSSPFIEHPFRWMRKKTDAFINKYIRVRKLDVDDWNSQLAAEYDAFLVGSDQVWRSAYAYPLDRYFLGFLNDDLDSLRIAYAASFGLEQCDYSDKQMALCVPLLQKFQAVSVREKSAVAICKNSFGVEAQQVLDPTLLLSREDYLSLLPTITPSFGNLLVYVLDRTNIIDEWINHFAVQSGFKPFYVNSRIEDGSATLSERQQPPLEQWLSGFVNAEFVLTDSFHACVFAIIFNKPFLCIGNQERGMSRFNSLLEQFGLEACLRLPNQSFDIPQIDWDQVNEKLTHLQCESVAFLKKNIHS